MQPIKIALGDLRHATAGKHVFLMPVGIGYIASYLLAQTKPGDIEIRLYHDPKVMLEDIADWKPQVVGLSNYCWNGDLSRTVFRHAKRLDPSVVCVGGGPNFPTDHAECHDYLSKRPEIDLYVYFEGEASFAQLIKKLQKGSDVHHLKAESQDGVMSVHPKTGNLVFGKPLPRITNLDEIPSPYLNGLLDQWFNGYYAPSMETARGCPFSCGYCFAGKPYYNHMATFSVERIKEELTYIAQRMKGHPDILLSICDSNFGMTERDEKIAAHIRKLQDEFNWPNAFDVTTGKMNYDRILRIASLLKNRLYVGCSLQSLNPKTLEAIKRKNLSMHEYRKLNAEMKECRMHSATEFIVPLPEETKDSFFKGSECVMNTLNVDYFTVHTAICLNGTYLASKECREQYKMQTKFRILPRQFGEYLDKKYFEVEEVCVATNTMSFDDYLEIRGFSLILSFFSNELFDVIHRHLKELNINRYDYFYHIWESIKSGKDRFLLETYKRYMVEVKEELWDSKDAIYDYFTKQENYKKLPSGSRGDNLIRKYKTELFLKSSIPAIELAYFVMKDIAGNGITDEIRESLTSAKRWMKATRNVSVVFKDRSQINNSEIIDLPYDVNSWYLHNPDRNPLVTYNKQTSYGVFSDSDNLKMIFDEIEKLYGGNFSFQIGKLLENWDIKKFCRKCEPLNK